MGTPSVLGVVLSFNTQSDTLECLESLQLQDCPNLSLLVIDNASTDGSQQAIQARFPDIELLALDTNLGWAGGNNVGIRIGLERNVDQICLLNNDLVLQETALRLLSSAYARLGSCLLHPGIYYYSDPNSPQLDPSTTGSTTGGVIGKLPASDGEDVWELDHAYGACLMVGTEVFRRIGLLDERFFLQLEETDFFLRAQRQGLRALCVPSARVLHKESVAFGGRTIPIKTYYGIRNNLLLTEKNTTFGSRKFFTYLKRRLYWHLRSLHREIGSGSFLGWMLSADAFAVAVRRGVLDYAMRRFGRVNANSARAIEKSLAASG